MTLLPILILGFSLVLGEESGRGTRDTFRKDHRLPQALPRRSRTSWQGFLPISKQKKTRPLSLQSTPSNLPPTIVCRHNLDTIVSLWPPSRGLDGGIGEHDNSRGWHRSEGVFSHRIDRRSKALRDFEDVFSRRIERGSETWVGFEDVISDAGF
jgi:hypothetical protein